MLSVSAVQIFLSTITRAFLASESGEGLIFLTLFDCQVERISLKMKKKKRDHEENRKEKKKRKRKRERKGKEKKTSSSNPQVPLLQRESCVSRPS